MTKSPYLIQFPKIGESALGYISVAEGARLPFPVKRVYWTYYTPQGVTRGRHAHWELEQVMVAMAGKITVQTEMVGGEKDSFVLDHPDIGLYIPTHTWHTMEYSHDAVQMCLASTEYAEADYIREYEQFKRMLDG